MADSYSIKSRSHRCSLTEVPFQEGDTFVAAIFPDPDSDGYLRRDFSLQAWQEKENNPEEEIPFSFWKSHYKPPVKEEEVRVTSHNPEALFTKLVEENEEHTENARFILAVMLERKKLLRETDTQQLPSALLRIYEHRKTGHVYIVKDPQIALADVDTIQEEIHRLLDPEAYESEAVPDELADPSPEPLVADQSATAESTTADSLPEQMTGDETAPETAQSSAASPQVG